MPKRAAPAERSTERDTHAGETADAAAIKPDRRRAPETKKRILDAAEALFAERGYYGTSIRDISAASKVQNAQTYHHFGSKEGLFRAVIERRADAHSAALRQSLDDLIAEVGEEGLTLENVFRAFITPIVERVVRRGAGWRNYVKLLGQVASQPEGVSFVAPFSEYYDEVQHRYFEHVLALCPHLSRKDGHWAFYFFQAAITHAIIETGMIDRQSGGLCRSSDLDAFLEQAVRFYAAGFRAMDERRE